MTNSSPQNPQPNEPNEPSSYSPEEVQRIRRNTRIRATEEVTDEWIAAIVAFGTVGAILFWSLGGNKSNFANLSQSSFFSSSTKTTETKGNLNSDLGVQDFVDRRNLNNGSVTGTSDDNQSSGILDSGLSYFSSLSKDDDKQKNKSFASVPLIASDPSLTKAVIPQPVLEEDTPIEPEIETSPNSEADTETDTGVIAFADVTEDYWAYPFLSQLGEKRLIPDSSSFDPDEPITRAGMASLISSAFKNSPEIEGTTEFTDVPADSNLVADINKAVAMGFMNGYSEGDFRPEQNIPRYQVLVSLATGLKLEPSGDANTILQNFRDREELPEWSLDKVAAATEAGLAINRPGFALTSLNPNEPATRAEVAAMIYQTLAKSGTVSPIESEYIVPTP